jgi:hypothetical protein
MTPDPITDLDTDRSLVPLFKGVENNPLVPHGQETVPDAPDTATGLSTKESLTQALTRSASDSGPETDNTIALGAERAFGGGGKNLQGLSSEIGGGLARFGHPGGGNVFVDARPHKQGVKKIVFLCDSSGSMITKFDALRAEIRKAVDGLKPVQEFDVIFFAGDSYLALDKQLVFALPENKRKAYEFLDTVAPHSSSDPIPGLRAAFAAQPQLIFMLTDGDFPNNAAVLDEVRKLSARNKVMVNTIAFVDRGETYEKLLSDVAKETGGTFRFVGEEELSVK